jgi:hypothetical protein
MSKVKRYDVVVKEGFKTYLIGREWKAQQISFR